MHLQSAYPQTVIQGSFLFAEIKDNCILGLDLLRSHGLIADIHNRLIKGRNDDLPLCIIQGDCFNQIKMSEEINGLYKTNEDELSLEQIEQLR